MSEEDSPSSTNVGRESVDVLLDNSSDIRGAFESIEWVFEDTLNSERIENSWNDYRGTMQTKLYDEIEGENIDEISAALLNVIANWNLQLFKHIKEKDEDLAEKLKNLSAKYGLPVQRRAQRINQGRNYWSNIKSEIGVRSDSPKFTHEITLDHERTVEFQSGLDSTLVLAYHFLQQVDDAPNTIGEDLLSFIDKNQLEEIIEISQSLLEDVEEYESEALTIESEDSSKDETTSDRDEE